MKQLFVAVSLMFVHSVAVAQLDVLKDINHRYDPISAGIDADYLTDVNGVLFFKGKSEKGYELWRSDGTSSGTKLVKDIFSGTESSSPNKLINVNGVLFFVAENGAQGMELWKSDGTEAGTVLVKDITPGSNASPFHEFFVAGSTLYFTLKNNDFYDLWKSDGSETGTVLIMGNVSGSARGFASINSTLFFPADDGSHGVELWRTDGTIVGTSMVKDIWAGTNASAPGFLEPVGNLLYFVATDPLHGYELWKSDGTEGGTVLVDDLKDGPEDTSPNTLTNVGGTLFFFASDGVNSGLWKSDGAESNTVFLKSFTQEYWHFDNITVVNDLLFFSVINAFRNELWRSDGTPEGTKAIKDLSGALTTLPTSFEAVDNTLFLVAQKDGSDLPEEQIWKSDGSSSGTITVTDFPRHDATSGSKSLSRITRSGNYVFFVYDDGINGNELWISDLTGTTVERITDLPNDSYFSLSHYLTEYQGNLYFAAYDETYGMEMWKSDGTPSGTSILRDISPGTSSSGPADFTKVNTELFFLAQNGLWKTDGTSAGTMLVSNAARNINNMVAVNNTLFFAGYDATNGSELWKSNGTNAGTQMVVNIGGDAYSNPYSLTSFKDQVYFVAYDGETALWKSDGTPTGTQKIKPFQHMRDLRSDGEWLYFLANDGIQGMELWRSDGTFAGTSIVKDIFPGSGDAFDPTVYVQLAFSDQLIYVVANDGVHGFELWKTDGTEAGTAIVKDIVPGNNSPSITNLKTIGNTVYFSADDGIHGAELWKSNGSENETTLVLDIFNGAYNSLPMNMIEVNHTLYFTAYDGTLRTLWKSNGKACGTIKVTDNTQVSAGGLYRGILAIDQTIFVKGSATVVGEEIFVHRVNLDRPIPASCKLNQSIDFSLLVDKTFGNEPFSLAGFSTSGLPLSYVTSSPKISISGNVVTLLSPGNATITAMQSGDDSFNPATSVAQNFCINPGQPGISAQTFGDHSILTSSNENGNQWYKDGVPLLDETNETLEVMESGAYEVEVSIDGCTSLRSNNFEIIITGIESLSEYSLNVYPNPTTGFAYVNNLRSGTNQVIVTDCKGNQILKTSANEDTLKLDLWAVPSGLYFVQVISSEGVNWKRIIVAH